MAATGNNNLESTISKNDSMGESSIHDEIRRVSPKAEAKGESTGARDRNQSDQQNDLYPPGRFIRKN